MYRFTRLTTAQRNDLIRQAAYYFAEKAHRQAHPDAPPALAAHHAQDHWREYVPQAIDWVALCTALEEAEAAHTKDN